MPKYSTALFPFTSLHSQTSGKFDWIKPGKYFNSSVTPPRVDLEATQMFGSSQNQTINEKLQMALARQELLEKEKTEQEEVLSRIENKTLKMILSELIACWYSEYFLIEKWVRYWLRIHDVVNENSGNFKEFEDWGLNIEKAKESPIEELYVGQLRKAGGRLVGSCPFHLEKTPSFYIFNDNHWHCFGCGEHGDSIDFLMKTENLEFKQAVRRLI